MTDLTFLAVFVACALATFALVRACGSLLPASISKPGPHIQKGDRP